MLERAITSAPKKEGFLDVGAGSGRISLLLSTAGFAQGVAVEVAPPAGWDEVFRHAPQLYLFRGLLQDFQPEYTFDLAFLGDVFEHIPPDDIETFLNRLFACMNPHGIVYVVTPNRTCIGPAEESPLFWKRLAHGHYRHYTVDEMREIFSRHGFACMWSVFLDHDRSWWTRVYRFYMFAARWDQRFGWSPRVGKMGYAYRLVTWPFAACLRLFFVLVDGFIAAEARSMLQDERTGRSITVCFRKAGLPI